MDRSTPPLSFDGESVTTCRLLDGPIADLNLMVRRGHGVGSLHAMELRAGQPISVAGDDVALVVLDGSLRFGADELHAFDAGLRTPGQPVQGIAITRCSVAVIGLRPG